MDIHSNLDGSQGRYAWWEEPIPEGHIVKQQQQQQKFTVYSCTHVTLLKLYRKEIISCQRLRKGEEYGYNYNGLA